MPAEKLCFHAFMGLHNLTWHRYLELERYYWPGFTDEDRIKDKFLTIEVNKNWIKVEQKDRYGNIFKSNIGFEEREKFSLKSPAKKFKLPIGGVDVIEYCLANNFGSHHQVHLSVLTACLEVTNKSDNDVVSSKQFNHQRKPIAGVNYTLNKGRL